jgi:hypothetical protein
VAETIPQLTHFLPEEFDVQPESFAQWWDVKDLPDTLIKDRDTVNGIASVLIPRFVDFDRIEDKGLALQQELPALIPDGYFNLQDWMVPWLASQAWSVMADAKIHAFSTSSEQHIDSLDPVRWLPDLEKLEFAQMVSDLEPLSGLTKLKELIVTGPVRELDPLLGMTELSELTISGNNMALRDASQFRQLPQLEYLVIYGSAITDVSPLRDLPRLHKIQMAGTPIATVAPILDRESLSILTFGSTQSPTADTKLLAQHPWFKTQFVRNDTVTLDFEDGAVSTWIRRGETNLFDTRTVDAAGSREDQGVGAYFGGGEFSAGAPSQEMVWLYHRRADELVCLWGFRPADSQQTSGSTFILPPDNGEALNLNGFTNGPSWIVRGQ